MYQQIKNIFLLIRDFFCPPGNEEIIRRKKISDYNYLRSCGVETQLGYVTLVGKPSIQRAQGARIIIGKGVTLVSEATANTAGINHPVIISAEGVNSIIKIGDGVGISGASIVTCSSIEIGEETMIGANCNIYGTDFHCISAENRLKQKSTAPKCCTRKNELSCTNYLLVIHSPLVKSGISTGILPSAMDFSESAVITIQLAAS